MAIKSEDRLESLYMQFVHGHNVWGHQNKIDYIGINIGAGHGAFQFKTYYRGNISQTSTPLKEALLERDLLRFFTEIHSDDSLWWFDIGLKNRINDNIENLFDILKIHAGCSEVVIDRISELSEMSISDHRDFRKASLYFVGIKESLNHQIMLKTHFLTRKCKNPDIIYKDIQYCDDYYLDFLRQRKIPLLTELIPYTQAFLVQNGGHLWMVGADFLDNNIYKYKIYIKSRTSDFFVRLEALLSEMGNNRFLTENVHAIGQWAAVRDELCMDGMAFAMDASGNLSINLYFKLEGTDYGRVQRV